MIRPSQLKTKFIVCFLVINKDLDRKKRIPHYTKPSHLNGLSKIHKASMPLRPIVS